MQNSTIQIRIGRGTKAKVKKAFADVGLDLSSGMRLFLTHVGRTGEVPFELFTYDNASQAFKKKLFKEADEAIRGYKRGKLKGYRSSKALLNDILGKEK